MHRITDSETEKSDYSIILLYITVLWTYSFEGKIITCLKKTGLVSYSFEQEASSRALV